MFKKYFVYVDDGDNVMKIAVPAKMKKTQSDMLREQARLLK